MSDHSFKLKDRLGKRLLELIEAPEVDPRILTAALNYLKEYPPVEIPEADSLSPTLAKYSKLPFNQNEKPN